MGTTITIGNFLVKSIEGKCCNACYATFIRGLINLKNLKYCYHFHKLKTGNYSTLSLAFHNKVFLTHITCWNMLQPFPKSFDHYSFCNNLFSITLQLKIMAKLSILRLSAAIMMAVELLICHAKSQAWQLKIIEVILRALLSKPKSGIVSFAWFFDITRGLLDSSLIHKIWGGLAFSHGWNIPCWDILRKQS